MTTWCAWEGHVGDRRIPKVRPLTEEEEWKFRVHPPAQEANIAARLEALRRAYEGTIGVTGEATRHLFAALRLCGSIRPLPRWAFEGLDGLQSRLSQEPDRHGGRWLLVREGRAQGYSWENSYDYAAERLAGTPWAGEPRTMKASYHAEWDRKNCKNLSQ